MNADKPPSTDAQAQHAFYDNSDSGTQWATPQWIWHPLANALDGFDLDAAAGCEPTPIAATRYTPEDDGLEQPWYGDVWLNPPYGRGHNKRWAEKAATEAQRETVDTITALVPDSIGSQWYQDNYGTADLETHIRGRVRFLGAGDHPASFYSVLVTWGDVPDAYRDALHELGTVRKILHTPSETRQATLSP